MASRWARVVRGLLTAGISVFVAALSHVAGGGSDPGSLGVILALAFGGVLSIGLAGKSLSLLRLGISVAVSQFAFHLLFTLGAGTSAAAVMDAGSAHVHGAMIMPIAVDASAAVMPMHNDPSMWAAHAAAAVITIVLLRQGESALWGLMELARATWAAVVVSRFVSTISVPVDAMRMRSAVSDRPAKPRLESILAARPRRGPPAIPALSS